MTQHLKTSQFYLIIAYCNDKYGVKHTNLNWIRDREEVAKRTLALYIPSSKSIWIHIEAINKDQLYFHELCHHILLSHFKLRRYKIKHCITAEYFCEWFTWYIIYNLDYESARMRALEYITQVRLKFPDRYDETIYNKGQLNKIQRVLKEEAIKIQKALRDYR